MAENIDQQTRAAAMTRDECRVEAENLSGLYIAIRNPNKLAGNLRHLVEADPSARRMARRTTCACLAGPPTGADFDIHDETCEATSWSICGSFSFRGPTARRNIDGGATTAAHIENLLAFGGLCQNCLKCARLDRFTAADRALIVATWPGETFRRFDGASLAMISAEMERARRNATNNQERPNVATK